MDDEAAVAADLQNGKRTLMQPPDARQGVPAGDAGQSLSRSTMEGVKWTYAASLVGALLQVGYTAAMARLLTPSDFGVLAVAMVFLRFGQHFAQMGVGPAIVQSPTMTDRKVSSGFALTMALSVAMAAAFIAIAGFAKALLDDPEIVPVVRVMALGMVLIAAGTTAESLLRRELRFRRLAINQLASFSIGYILVGITCAVLGGGVWSLVAAHLSQLALNGALNTNARRHPVGLGWTRSDAADLISFGGRVSVISFMEFLGSSLDTLVIGRVAGSGALGQYNRAFFLVHLPLEKLLQGVQRVLFPAFSRIQTERERLARVYRSALGLTGAMVVPTAAGMSMAAVPLVLAVLGDRWLPAADLLPFLAFSAAGSLLALPGAIACEATADLNRKLLLQSSHVTLLFLLLLAAGSDLRMLAGAVAVAQLIRVVGYFGFMRRVIGVTLREQFALLLPAFSTGAMIAAAGALWNTLFAEQLSPLALLAVHVASGMILLLLSLRIGPLSIVRRDLVVWLDRAASLSNVPAAIRRLGGLTSGL
jgi:lipopolysaccharide exporter